MLSQPAIVEYG